MELSFLFWNTMRKDLRHLLEGVARERTVDVLALAESAIADVEILAALSRTQRQFFAHSIDRDKVRVFSTIASENWVRLSSGSLGTRLAVWQVNAGRPPGFLFATAHLMSKLNESADGQALLAIQVAQDIEAAEDYTGMERTVFVGDLNMNPFEIGVIGFNALHAVMTRAVADRRTRTYQGMERRFFYNPMWAHFGDRTPGPPGTYYHRSARAAEHFWHVFDQVLVRPELTHGLRDLEILDKIEGVGLLKANGTPNADDFSDHLPLAFRINTG